MVTDNATLELLKPIVSVSVIGGRPANTGAPGSGGATTDTAEIAEMRVALKEDRAKLQAAKSALEHGAAELAEFRGKVIEETGEQLFVLALGIARKVLMQEIQAGRYEIEPIVREALCHVPIRQDVVIRLNPQDYANCGMVEQQDDSAVGGSIRFLADPDVAPAECILETPEGVVESSPEAHLARIAETLGAQ